jgi:hypothetical protein
MIFCRNVMIYFDQATQQELADKFSQPDRRQNPFSDRKDWERVSVWAEHRGYEAEKG